MTNQKVTALLDMEGTIDDLEGIADVLSRMVLAPQEIEGPGPAFLARITEEKVEKLKDQWKAALDAEVSPAPGPTLVDDGAT